MKLKFCFPTNLILLLAVLTCTNFANAKISDRIKEFKPTTNSAEFKRATMRYYDMRSYSICMSLATAGLASETMEGQLPEQEEIFFAMLFESGRHYRLTSIANGVPANTLDDAVRAYGREFISDRNRAIQKYGPLCMNIYKKIGQEL